MNTDHLLWVLFLGIAGSAFFVDLFMKSHQHRHAPISLKEATHWTLIWFGLALAFAGLVWGLKGPQMGMEFLAAYLLEESLSVDNMFVFVMIFGFFKIPPMYQPKVLKYGIFGAIIMRFIMIFMGMALVKKFDWLFYIFGALLLYTAVHMLWESGDKGTPDENWLLRVVKRFVPMTSQLHEEHFFIRQNGRRLATPLFAAVLVVEASDLIFALDSIPACLAISQHPFIVFSSNIFAIMGLRALYFLISGVMQLFRFLRFGLSAILAFIGTKMILMHHIQIPILLSLGVVVSCLLLSIVASLLIKEKTPNAT